MVRPEAGHLDARIALALLAVLIAVANFAVHWPGALTPDSKNQLGQVMNGVFDDWHPPIMAHIWSLLGGSMSGMLALQIGLHWFGFWALSEAVRQKQAGRWSFAMLAVGLTPIAIKYTGVIQKDSLLASFLVAAFGTAALTGRYHIPALLGAVGALCRANAVFALTPLFLPARRETNLLRSVGLCLIASLALVPVSRVINHELLQAKRTGVERSVQLFDLAGIARFSGDTSVLPARAQGAERCYTPLFWDTLPTEGCAGRLETLPPSLTRAWIGGIAAHPLAYAQHRLAHFNATTFFIVPPMQQCVEAPRFHSCDFSQRGLLVDFAAKNAFLWPVTWLAIGMLLLFHKLNPLAHALNLSGLLYGAAYLIVGVAADFRYFYWTELAVQTAAAFHIAQGGRLAYWKLMTAVVAGIWVLGYSARLVML